VQASSSFTAVAVTPSKVPVSALVTKDAPAVCKEYVWGLFGVCLLILLGGGHSVYAQGCALALSGLALWLRPPERGLGKWLDLGVFGVLASLLCAFVPLFYWQQPAWRTTALETFGLDLPWSLSVQPWLSLEAYLLALAGFSWLYVASGWQVNHSGRKWLYFWLSCMMAIFAGVVVLGNLYGLRYPGAGSATAFSFFPNQNQTYTVIALGGVLTFGYAMDGLRGRHLIQAAGFVASVLCLLALVYGASFAGLWLYFGGICWWLMLTLWRSSVLVFFKISISAVLLFFIGCMLDHEPPGQGLKGGGEGGLVEWGQSAPMRLYRDVVDMIEEAPLTGHGVGTFKAIFPQYRTVSHDSQGVRHPESDLLWLAAEGGLAAVGFLGLLLAAYFYKCRRSGVGRSGAFRMIALSGVVGFVVHGLLDVPGHSPGTVYFAIIWVALALPHANGTEARPTFKPVVWRSVGGGLLFCGGLWVLGGLFELPTHSSVAWKIQEQRVEAALIGAHIEEAEEAVDQAIALQPLYWRSYFQRAQIGLLRDGPRDAVAQDFRRARFVAPNIGMIAYEEGVAWLPYDVARTMSAWRAALTECTDNKDDLYWRMLAQASKDVQLLEGVRELSQLDPDYRVRWLLFLTDAMFIRAIEQERGAEPSLGRFTAEQRMRLLRRWIAVGGADDVDAYLRAYGDTLEATWLLYAQIRHKQYRYQEAVDMMRVGLAEPEMPDVPIDLSRIDREKRGFFTASNDVFKGTALMRYCIVQGDYSEALLVADQLLKHPNPPSYVYYWRAQILYELDDFSESWYAFQEYWNRLRGAPVGVPVGY
jgi:tetratricopeptide (TPR) repeat protein